MMGVCSQDEESGEKLLKISTEEALAAKAALDNAKARPSEQAEGMRDSDSEDGHVAAPASRLPTPTVNAAPDFVRLHHKAVSGAHACASWQRLI